MSGLPFFVLSKHGLSINECGRGLTFYAGRYGIRAALFWRFSPTFYIHQHVGWIDNPSKGFWRSFFWGSPS